MAVKIEYLTPKTIQEACKLASQYKDDAEFIAGGTDLVIQMKHKDVLPKYIINISGLGLDYIKYSEKTGLKLGGMATIHSIATSPVIKEKFTSLAYAASQLGSNQIRRAATVAGNLVHAAPSAETACPLLTLDAKVKLIGPDGERTMALESFFTGPGKTVIKPGEILAEVSIPNLPARSGTAYIKHSLRKSMDLSAAGVAVALTLDGEVISDIKIAYGAVAPVPMRAPKAEALIKGKKISEQLFKEVDALAHDECRPIDDIRACSAYRRDIIGINTVRAMQQAIAQAKS